MIMLLTYRAELREQITKSLKAMGHELCLPAHRTDVTAMKESPPDLVILDMYLDNPASSLVLQNLREDGYQGAVILLSGPSQGATLDGSHFFGRHRVLQLPMQIAGAYELAELRTAVATCLTDASRASQGDFHGQAESAFEWSAVTCSRVYTFDHRWVGHLHLLDPVNRYIMTSAAPACPLDL